MVICAGTFIVLNSGYISKNCIPKLFPGKIWWTCLSIMYQIPD